MRRLHPIHRSLRRPDRRFLLRLGIVSAVCYAAWLAVTSFGRPYSFFDMAIYHGAMVWWTNGGDLYEFIAPDTTLGFTYPPFAALVMLPMAALPLAAAGWINVVISVAALALVLAAIIRPTADRLGWALWFTVGLTLPLALALEPARETLGFGQVNLLLFALIMADMVGLRWCARGDHHHAGPLRRFWLGGAWAGAGIGLAAAIKVFPALFIVYLMMTRQWRPAVTALGTAAGVTLATFSIAGRESATYFTGVLWQTDRVGAADMTPNQSLAGLLARLYDSIETPGLLYVTFALVLLVVGLSRAANAHAEGDELAAFTLVGLTANVISPISWSHHLVFVLPAIIVLVDTAVRRRSASRLVPRGTTGIEHVGVSGVHNLRPPIWFPTLTGLRHAVAALGTYLLFLVSPIWRYEHQLPQVSHYQDGLFGAFMENSFALALVVLVTALPWRPGAEPVFHLDAALRRSPAAFRR